MSYHEELKQLMKWRFDEEDKLEAAHIPQPGFDDWRAPAIRPIVEEFNRKWAELREKYGVPAPEPKIKAPTPHEWSDEELLKIFGGR